MTSSAAKESPSGLPSVGHNLKGEPEDYMKDFAGELGNAKRAGYDEPLSVGVGKAEWYHCGWHMCTAVAGPALLGLPFAMSLLGWPAGIVVLLLGYFVTLYTSTLIAKLHETGGKRNIRYRDLAETIFGTKGKIMVWICQWSNLIGGNISIFVQVGLSVQLIYQLTGNNTISLTEWIAIIGAVAIVMTQLPTFHSLRYVNGISMICTYCFTLIAFILAIYQGHKYSDLIPKNYGVHGSPASKIFGVFLGISIMSFAYGNTIIPEIQATAKPPSAQTMYRAIGVLYTLLAVAYIPISIAGYWAYGNLLFENGASYLPNQFAMIPAPNAVLSDGTGPTSGARPEWAIILLLAFTIIGAVIGIQLYNAPVLEFIEERFIYARSEGGIWGFRNWLTRTVLRAFWIFLLCLVAALFPFFGDILALIGALGITPIDFILPCAMYVKVYKPRGLVLMVNIAIISLYTVVGIMGTISAIRGIVTDASKYSVFPHSV